MNEQDEVRVRHMLDAAREVLAFAEGQTREALDANRMLVRAMTMSIGIIGEAASQVSDEFQAAHREIPWPQIIGMRNRLIHAYFDINLDIVWETVTTRIPELIDQLENLLAASE